MPRIVDLRVGQSEPGRHVEVCSSQPPPFAEGLDTADLKDASDIKDVQDSALSYKNAVFHFIRVDA